MNICNICDTPQTETNLYNCQKKCAFKICLQCFNQLKEKVCPHCRQPELLLYENEEPLPIPKECLPNYEGKFKVGIFLGDGNIKLSVMVERKRLKDNYHIINKKIDIDVFDNVILHINDTPTNFNKNEIFKILNNLMINLKKEHQKRIEKFRNDDTNGSNYSIHVIHIGDYIFSPNDPNVLYRLNCHIEIIRYKKNPIENLCFNSLQDTLELKLVCSDSFATTNNRNTKLKFKTLYKSHCLLCDDDKRGAKDLTQYQQRHISFKHAAHLKILKECFKTFKIDDYDIPVITNVTDEENEQNDDVAQIVHFE